LLRNYKNVQAKIQLYSLKIEFEYRSINFREHGHNPSECDLIVCWEHDWKECPIEVIEFKKVLEELED